MNTLQVGLLVTALLSLPELPLDAARPVFSPRSLQGASRAFGLAPRWLTAGHPHSGCDSVLDSASRWLTLRADFDGFFAGLNFRPYGPRHENALDEMAAELDGKFKGVRRNPIPPNSCSSCRSFAGWESLK